MKNHRNPRRSVAPPRQLSTTLPPNHFEQIRTNAVSVERIQNVDVVTTPSNETFGYCHMPYFFPFSFFPAQKREPFEIQAPFEGAAAIHLAMMHLNTGNGRVVPEVQGLNERCNIRFTFDIHDTEMWETTTVNQVIEVLNLEASATVSKPCAFLGAGRSAVTMPMAIITGVSGYAQMSGISTSSQLDDKSQYKYFSRLIPSDDGTAIPVLLYLRHVVQTQHLAVIHDNNLYSTAFLESLQRAKTQHHPTLNIQSIDIPFNQVSDQDLKTAVSFLKSTQYRYIFSIIDGPKVWARLMTEAYHQGIAGTEYVWIHTDSLFPSTITSLDVEPNSPLAEAARGSSMLEVQSGLAGTPVYDNFIAAFHELNTPEHIDFLQSKHPVYDGEESYKPLQVERIFRTQDPGNNAIFLYDATIAMGLAACAAADPYFDGPTHYKGITNTSFVGASGEIVIDPTTGSRDPSSAYFQLINFVERQNEITGNVSFDAIQTDLFKDGAWTSLRPYIYGDGTSNMPPSLPVVGIDHNYLSPGLRGTGLALSGLVILLSIAFSVWTIQNRQTKVICASQPIFLLFVCAGVLLMGSAIIPLSIDDKIASNHGCDIACMAAPWLFVLGFAAAFAALFSKTWRINKIFHHPAMRRIKVTALDVMTPLIALLIVNLVLLSLWTALAPLEWTRGITQVDVFGQTVETQGRCESTAFVPFVVVLSVVNMGALMVAAYQAYKARGVSVEFSESAFIGRAIGLFLLACLYGIPILVITWEDPSARYFVLMGLSVICSLSVLLFIFIPKVMYLRSGRFTKASHAVAQSLRSNGRGHASGAEAGGPFVSGIETHSIVSDDTDGVGVLVIDDPQMRADLKKENHFLLESKKALEERVKELEETERRNSVTLEMTAELLESKKALEEHVKELEAHDRRDSVTFKTLSEHVREPEAHERRNSATSEMTTE